MMRPDLKKGEALPFGEMRAVLEGNNHGSRSRWREERGWKIQEGEIPELNTYLEPAGIFLSAPLILLHIWITDTIDLM